MKLLHFCSATLVAFTLTGTNSLAQMGHDQHSTSSMDNAMSSLGQLSGKAFDQAYLSMMIAHHQGAIEMSKVVLNVLKDPQVKQWANAIIRDQANEINSMTDWLKNLGGSQSNMYQMMSKAMSPMIALLKSSTQPDEAFVRNMLMHHGSALEMANMALQQASDPRVLQLSRDIIKAQADEMYAFRQWLAQKR